MREGRACRDCCPWAAIAGAMNCDPPANHLHLHFYTSARPFRTTAGTPSPLLRPHARLASLGGCVATVATSATLPCTDTTARHRRYYCDPPHCSSNHSMPPNHQMQSQIINRKIVNSQSLPSTFLHFYTAIFHTTAGRRRHNAARRRGTVATMPHDGEAPSLLLRPLARLTSFGGYVAALEQLRGRL